MALWDDAFAEVLTWTNKPALIAETTLALRQAIRTAHRTRKFYKDLVTSPAVVPDPVGSAALDDWNGIQTIALPDVTTRYRQLKSVAYPIIGNAGAVSQPPPLVEVEADDLFDADKYWKKDVYWVVGATLNIRASVPQDTYDILYYQQPITTPTVSVDSWILADENYREVPVLMAASTVLAILGEQEIKSRVDQLLAISISTLIADNVEATGR